MFSFSRMRMPKDEITPKIFYDKWPVRAEGDGTTIKVDTKMKPDRGILFHSNEIIRHSDIEVMWCTGNYDTEGSPCKVNRLTNIKQISQYYMPEHSVRYDVDVPFFMPTDKIYLSNSKRAVDE